jgi:hypothetical protein
MLLSQPHIVKMMHISHNLTHEEQAALFQTMTVEQLKALKGTPVKMNWSKDDLAEIAASQQAEDALYSPYFTFFQQMTPAEINNFTALNTMSMTEKVQKTGLPRQVIETIENDATQAIYGDILRYCKNLGISKALFLESLLEEERI